MYDFKQGRQAPQRGTAPLDRAVENALITAITPPWRACVETALDYGLGSEDVYFAVLDDGNDQLVALACQVYAERIIARSRMAESN